MAKDARGHGSEKRGVVGPSNASAIGHFLKALQGIHRTVPGHPGEVPTGQGQPVTVRHSNTPSVGTESGGVAMPAGAEDRINKMLAPLRQSWRDFKFGKGGTNLT